MAPGEDGAADQWAGGSPGRVAGRGQNFTSLRFTMPIFDTYIFVDWSGRYKLGPPQPDKDNVWIGEHYSNEKYCEKYCRSRSACTEYLFDILKNCIRKRSRVLIGFDFPYGYPKGFANALELDNGPQSWSLIWEELSNRIQDEDNNNNNRFQVANDLNARIGGSPPGPFWGHPQGQTWTNLMPRSPGFPFRTANGISLERFRLVEKRIRGVQETWKLFGKGSVGSQALVGIPRLYELRNHKDLSRPSKIWPFETGFSKKPFPKQGPFILHAEIWPGIVSKETQRIISEGKSEGKPLINDKAQVQAMCKWTAELDYSN